MHWLQYVGEFAWGFLNGMADGQAQRQPAALSNAGSSSYDFAEHMQHLSRASGLELLHVTHEKARFDVTINGEPYPVAAYFRGDTIILTVVSNIKFPSGRAPRDVCQYLAERNRKLRTCDYDLLNDEDEAFFFIYGRAKVVALTPEVFNAAVKVLVPEIAGLDQMLVKEGYVR
jgi:hypothetical protein